MTILLYRMKNRTFIFASQRPEVFFIVLIMVIAGGSTVIFLPSLLDYNVDITIDQFPKISYTFITASIFPFIIWILKMNYHESEMHSILDYIFRDSFKYIKAFFNYFIPATISFIFMYLVLSIFQNVQLLTSILFWHLVGLFIVIVSYSLTLIVNNQLVKSKILKKNQLFFKIMVIGTILLIMVLPIHNALGRLWLSNPPNFLTLVFLWMILLSLYIFVYSRSIRYGTIMAGLNEKKQRFGNKENIYGFLLLIDIKNYYSFSFLSLLFMLTLSVISKQYLVMIDLFIIIVIIGNIGLVFGKIEKVAKGLFSLRGSNFVFALWLLHFYSALAFASILLFYSFITFVSSYDLHFLLSNTDVVTNMVVVYFCIYLSIVVAYTFGDYFGPIIQSLSSGIILIVSYRVIPDLLTKIISIQNILIEGILWIILIGILIVIKWITIQEFKNNEFI